MLNRILPVLAIGTAMVAIPVGFQLSESRSFAADHFDPPARVSPSVLETPDIAADIADIYAFHDDDSVTFILTFAGPQDANDPATFDPNVIYRINVSNAAPRTTTDIPIEIQFGPDTQSPNLFGVRVRNLPGVTDDLIGPVESNLLQDGVQVRAGLFDDPFFFDSVGFRETLDTGTLSFDGTRDFFAAQNLTAVAINIPRERIENGENLIDVWAETLRDGGQLND